MTIRSFIDIEETPEAADTFNEILSAFHNRGNIVTVYKRNGGEIADVEPELEHQTAIAILETDFEEWDPKKHPNACIVIIDPEDEEMNITSDLFKQFAAQIPAQMVTFDRTEESTGPYTCYAFLFAD